MPSSRSRQFVTPRGGKAPAFGLGFLLFSATIVAGFQDPPRPPIAIIVNRQNEISDVSTRDLKAIFRAEKRSWPAGKGPSAGRDVTLILRSSESREQAAILDAVYGMTAEQLERYWVEVVYQGKLSAPPATKVTSAQAIRAVARDPGAISVVLLKDVTPDVKVVTIDGKAAGAAGYLLGAEKP
ncbi:MAG TPA: substrate-binding domain-containing protein [Planctomycetota bacterium]|nr:substrate-binding domain-containing protein [Planctomycetota bacterium]